MKRTDVSDSIEKVKIATELQQLLHEQSIDKNTPGSILKDFETLLDYIGDRGLKTTSQYYLLPQGCLNELNSRMSRPMAHRLKRAQQRSFPLLHGLYLLLRTTGIGVGTGLPPSGRLTLNAEPLKIWLQLNPTEKYFALLENWLIHASTESFGESDRRSNVCMESFTWVFDGLTRSPVIQIEQPKNRNPIVHGTMSALTVSLMEAFGWISTEHAPPVDGETQQISRVELLPFGSAMTQLLMLGRFSRYPGYSGTREQKPGILQPLFRPYFPAWKQNLELPEPESRPGKYTWRVSVGKPWRRIVIPGDFSLDSLANAILWAFDFDNDHLYHFEFPNQSGRIVRYECPYCRDASAWTDEVAIEDLPLAEGAAMKFVFDYGDNWQFTVKLESVTEVDPALTEAKITQSSGKAPAQYGDEDDE